MNRQARLTAAALAALAMGGCTGAGGGMAGGGGSAKARFGQQNAARQASGADTTGKTGECWGVNECKGKGACGGVGHECAGGNACKGQGWLSLTKPDCDAKKGKFKAG